MLLLPNGCYDDKVIPFTVVNKLKELKLNGCNIDYAIHDHLREWIYYYKFVNEYNGGQHVIYDELAFVEMKKILSTPTWFDNIVEDFIESSDNDTE
jgi:hypothetical protein